MHEQIPKNKHESCCAVLLLLTRLRALLLQALHSNSRLLEGLYCCSACRAGKLQSCLCSASALRLHAAAVTAAAATAAACTSALLEDLAVNNRSALKCGLTAPELLDLSLVLIRHWGWDSDPVVPVHTMHGIYDCSMAVD
jgi:hypothetical protein